MQRFTKTRHIDGPWRPSIAERLTVGLFIPTVGDAGIWGPSCRACAELATHEVNRQGGVFGKEINLQIYEAGGDPHTTATLARGLVDAGAIDAIVGMHTSDVREAISEAIHREIPYVYTPLWEGGKGDADVLYIGETPDQQLLPSLEWLSDRYRLKRWYLIGHDYVWPRVNNKWARDFFKGRSEVIVAEKYVSLAETSFDHVIDDIARVEPCAVLCSLVGQGSVLFNRAFGRAGLGSKMLRLSTALEENILLGIGAANTEGLFGVSGYFSCVDNHQNGDFRERYHNFLGEYAPPLNVMSQSVYEGVKLVKDMFDPNRQNDRIMLPGSRQGTAGLGKVTQLDSIYLAEAKGLNFEIQQHFQRR